MNKSETDNLTFKGYLCQTFWYPMIEQVVYSRNTAYEVAGGYTPKYYKILNDMFNLIYPLVKKYISRQKFIIAWYQIELAITDTDTSNGFTVHDVFKTMKKKWNKNLKTFNNLPNDELLFTNANEKIIILLDNERN